MTRSRHVDGVSVEMIMAKKKAENVAKRTLTICALLGDQTKGLQ